MADVIWTLVGFFLTLLVFSYIFGDNPLFRFTSYLFVGVAAGYLAVLVIYQVLLPRLVYPLLDGSWIVIVPLVLCILLLTKFVPRLARVGSLPMAYLVGAGAAVMIGGAVMGTLLGQIQASIGIFDLRTSSNPPMQFLEGAFLLIGTISTLLYFHFGAVPNVEGTPKRSPLIEFAAKIGQIFIAITLGALFAGVLSATITALVERMDFLRNAILGFFS
jgi:hypothetical protein